MTRIIAGAAKGRRLAVPAEGTRPTSDRAREGLFNTLSSTLRFDGARVLDLFAGTGAVGLEALSRGAAEAVLVESNAKAAQVLRRNVAAVGLPGASVVVAPVNRFLSQDADEPFDLVFADPPYDHPAAGIVGLLATVTSRGWLAEDGTIVVERSIRGASGLETTIDPLTPFTEKRYGETALWYGRRR